MRRLTADEFIERANLKHNNKYLYDNVNYQSSTSKVRIICKLHGEFIQEANSHLRGSGCPHCSNNFRYDTFNFIEKSKLIHGSKYDYSKVEYKNSHTRIKIVCPIHGEFLQKAYSHLLYGCNKCGIEQARLKMKKDIEIFINESNKIHKNKYDYSKVEYVNDKKKVTIICSEHGEFQKTPYLHLKGGGCHMCLISNPQKKMKKAEKFIEESINIHGHLYDYSLVTYTHTDDKVDIICSKHGLFKQKPSKHLQGQGCPICRESKLEKTLRQFLINNNIEYKQQYGRKSDEFYLKGQVLDFYLPEYSLAIECQGDQHFIPVDFGNKGIDFAQQLFEKNKIYDKNKYKLCKDIGIDIIYYCNSENKKNNPRYIGELFDDTELIINEIRKYGKRLL